MAIRTRGVEQKQGAHVGSLSAAQGGVQLQLCQQRCRGPGQTWRNWFGVTGTAAPAVNRYSKGVSEKF